MATSRRGRQAAAQEAAVMRLLPPHPNVLRLYSCNDIDENTTVMLLQYATGQDTLKMMQERNLHPLSESHARQLFRQLISALECIHAAGVVHRDVKCENLLLTGADRRTLLLGDFGFATTWAKGKLIEEFLGSLHYSAPEICARVPYEGPEVDVWSAGVVLHAWATGRLPFGGQSSRTLRLRIVSADFPPPANCSLKLTDVRLR